MDNEYWLEQTPSPEGQLEQLLSKTRQPLFSEMKDETKCHICLDPFLSGENPEMPIKIACGHIIGIACMLKWLQPLSLEGKNSCPICRKPIIDDWLEEFVDDFPEAETQTERLARDFGETPPREREQATPEEMDLYHIVFPGEISAHDNGQAISEELHHIVFPREIPPQEPGEATLEVMDLHWEPLAINRERERGFARHRRRGKWNRVFQRLRNERNRRLWIQFCESIVRTVEDSDYLQSSTRLPVAHLILAIASLDELLRVRTYDPLTAQRILSTFPDIHTELILNRDTDRPIANIDLTSLLEAEERWGPGANFFMLHSIDWTRRLHEHGERILAEGPFAGEVMQRPEEVAGEGPSTIGSAWTRLDPPSLEDVFAGSNPFAARNHRSASAPAINDEHTQAPSDGKPGEISMSSDRRQRKEAISDRRAALRSDFAALSNRVESSATEKSARGRPTSAPDSRATGERDFISVSERLAMIAGYMFNHTLDVGNHNTAGESIGTIPEAEGAVQTAVLSALEVLGESPTRPSAPPNNRWQGRRSNCEDVIGFASMESDLAAVLRERRDADVSEVSEHVEEA